MDFKYLSNADGNEFCVQKHAYMFYTFISICRLRWANYLKPNVKGGSFTDGGEWTIIQLHALIGNR